MNSEKRKLVWEKELQLYDIFQTICENNGLKYFALAGTLLGAVRHKGFIPWDDDIDVAMPRMDYDRFVTIAQNSPLFEYPFFFQSSETDINYYFGNVRIRNSATTAITQRGKDRKLKFNQGIWLSIFPFDNVPDDERELETFKRKVYFLKTIIHYGNYMKISTHRSMKSNLMTILGKLCILIYGKQNLYLKYIKLITKYNHQETKRFASVATSSFSTRGKTFLKENYAKLKIVPFENRIINIPSGYENVLETWYGDWKIPRNILSTHGTTYFDLERPYTYYLDDMNRIDDMLLLD